MSSSAVVVTTVPPILVLLILLPVVMLLGLVLVTQVHAFPAYVNVSSAATEHDSD